MIKKRSKKNTRNFTEYYKNNKIYLKNLSKGKVQSFKKYIDFLSLGEDPILDIGCGIGQVVNFITVKERKAYGVDVSPLFIREAKKKGKGKFFLYDGKKLPFPDNFFGAVGCCTVLEHTENPEFFIKEMVRVVKPGGKLVLACPNFLAVITQGTHHWHNKGVMQKIKNLISLLIKITQSYLLSSSMGFNFMKPIIRENNEFLPDDDAICITNPIDCRFFLKKNNVKIIRHSSFLFYTDPISEFLGNLPLINYLFGGVFLVGEKYD